MSGHWQDLQAVPGQGGLKTLCWGPDPQCPQAHFIDEKNEAPEKAEPDLGPRILSSTAPNHTAHKVPEIHIYSHKKKKSPKEREENVTSRSSKAPPTVPWGSEGDNSHSRLWVSWGEALLAQCDPPSTFPRTEGRKEGLGTNGVPGG